MAENRKFWLHMCRNRHNSTSITFWTHQWTRRPKNLYGHEIFARRRRMCPKIPNFHCACAETGLILLPVTVWTLPIDSATPKTCIVMKFSPYGIGRGLKSQISLCMHRNGHNSTSGHILDPTDRPANPITYIWSWNFRSTAKGLAKILSCVNHWRWQGSSDPC